MPIPRPSVACCLILSMVSPFVCAGESYVSVGLPGLVAGYAVTVNEKLGLRADAGTMGSVNRTHTVSGVGFDTKAQYNRFGLFADYFPFGGRFRLTGGLTMNKAQLTLNSRFDGNTSINVNGQSITPSASDYFNLQMKFPTTMPYVGLGWGHQPRSAGMGFIADLGVSIGRAKLKTDTNIVGKTYNGYTVTQADVDAKTDEIHDAVGHITFLPSASVGVNYRY
ncbi:MAG: hypothetical protein EKK47_08030 [Burkholderiales bacterium]|jgi:hypothetical protein|nr:MAG: hypothetical protein EKK47_08030 [Burkholderiales bacterium]